MAERRVKEEIRRLFDSQSLGVLATHSEAGPYTSLVAFAADENLKNIYFVTSRFTRKYANIEADPRVAMLMDNRSDDPGDFRTATAVTAVGEASEISGQEKEDVLKRYLSKHRHLRDFVSSPTCALLRMRVRTYFCVTRFQEVVELHITR